MQQPGIGDIVDGFTIEELLHQGTATHLYRAQDSLSDDTVVLKVPLDNILSHPILFYHFQNEETLGRYLNHPGVVKFLVRQTSHLYLVEEFIDGQNLKTILQVRLKYPLREALALCLQICEALAYLHDKSILHLDLKPENIMVSPSGIIKLVDFGLGRHLGLRDYISADFNVPHGTPQYISPEQLCGHRCTRQSDIYSLGVTFYEMLTGNFPFKNSDDLKDVRERLCRDPIPPRYHDDAIPPAIQQIVLKMLNRDIEGRYRDIGELRHDLLAYEKLEETEEGRKTAKPSAFKGLFKSKDCGIYRGVNEEYALSVPVSSRKILACIVDHDTADMVVEEAKREALVRGGEITLLAVLEEDVEPQDVEPDSEFVGAGMARRLDGYISMLKNYQLQVTLRIRRGKAAVNIMEVAECLDSDVTILGPPRFAKGSGSVAESLGYSAIDQLGRRHDGEIRVLSSVSSGSGPRFWDEDGNVFEREKTLKVFLADLWVYHVNRIYEAVNDETNGEPDSIDSCPYSEWLEQFVRHLGKAETGGELLDVHRNLHRSVSAMTALPAGRNEFRREYRHEVRPLSERFLQLLQELGSTIKATGEAKK